MSRDGRKPWEIPIQYNDDRFAESTRASPPQGQPTGRAGDDDLDERDEGDVEELLRRPDVKEERDYECTDETPINYGRGPHDDEFGVDEHEFDAAAENAPLDYERGPHEEEFGVEDGDDFEALDDAPEFDDEV